MEGFIEFDLSLDSLAFGFLGGNGVGHRGWLVF